MVEWHKGAQIHGNFFPMGIGAIPILIYIHFHTFPFQSWILIPIPVGFPVLLGIQFTVLLGIQFPLSSLILCDIKQNVIMP